MDYNHDMIHVIWICFFLAALSVQSTKAQSIDLKEAVILIAKKAHSKTEDVAAQMLQEEVQKRTGLRWQISSKYDTGKPAIAIATSSTNELADLEVPRRDCQELPEFKPEGYRICVEQHKQGESVVWIVGADARGVLFGVGRLLRLLDWGPAGLLWPRQQILPPRRLTRFAVTNWATVLEPIPTMLGMPPRMNNISVILSSLEPIASRTSRFRMNNQVHI